jgi:hypothetical protein
VARVGPDVGAAATAVVSVGSDGDVANGLTVRWLSSDRVAIRMATASAAAPAVAAATFGHLGG